MVKSLDIVKGERRRPYKLLLLTLFWVLSFFYSDAQTRWDVKSYSITFKIKNGGLNIGGSLKGLQASIRFDKDFLAPSSIEASVEVATLDTKIGLRDKHLMKEEYFDVEKYPQMKLKSISLSKGKEGQFVGRFLLTIKNVSKEISIPFEFQRLDRGGNAQFKTQFTINRRDYAVGGKSWTMSDEVDVFLEVNVTESK
jgi:polyisoprenoid-binding protein YceI